MFPLRRILDCTLSPAEAVAPLSVRRLALQAAGISLDTPNVSVVQRRRSIDARGQHPKIILSVEIFIDESVPIDAPIVSTFGRQALQKRVVIVGAGPAGYFAALELIAHGLKPIVIERGKDVRARRRDLRDIQQFGIVHENSNYCFGEGGAGTYSDGKLYTRSSKRGDIHRVLRLLVEHGADPDILVDAHPHIGSNKLPQVVAAIRKTIEDFGGEVMFNSRVTDFLLKAHVLKGVIINESTEVLGDAVILATGHSARDIYTLCRQRGIRTEAKAFAMGVRVEHPQELIDEIQYRQRPRDHFLSAASYRLSTQIDGRGVYSFCMCPGGLIVPAATAARETVVNGMSMSRRDSKYANSGIVVEIRTEDLHPYAQHAEQAGIAYQRDIEQSAFQAGGDQTQRVAAQGLIDFCENRLSTSLPTCSYIPGTNSSPLHELLPPSLRSRLQAAFRVFAKSMHGYYTSEALVTAVESRTSTPVKIPRDAVRLEHPDIKGLYPCGEGAGYAGGIVSAAMDGQRVAMSIASALSTS